MGALGVATTLLIGTAITGTIAYPTAHGLSWLFGGWNAPATTGPTANAANRGHDPNTAIHGSSGPIRGTVPRGFRNNNPLNLTYVPGQIGVTGSDGRFGTYATMADGVAADERQMLLNQNRGADTLSKLITKWAPPGENDTAAYIARVTGETGIDPNAPINMRDPKVAAAVIGAMARHKNNGHSLDHASINNGIRAALGLAGGAPAQMASTPPAGAAGASGHVEVHVRTDAGTSASVKSTSGNVRAAPAGISQTWLGTAYAT